ncbi:MAG: hypothetical protein ACK4KW_14980, partial [Gemmobacter sp.]
MGRGFVAGAIWGLVVAVPGLIALSALTPMPPTGLEAPAETLATAPEPAGATPDAVQAADVAADGEADAAGHDIASGDPDPADAPHLAEPAPTDAPDPDPTGTAGAGAAGVSAPEPDAATAQAVEVPQPELPLPQVATPALVGLPAAPPVESPVVAEPAAATVAARPVAELPRPGAEAAPGAVALPDASAAFPPRVTGRTP